MGTQAVWTNTELMGTGSSTEWGTQTENVVQCGTFLHQGHADFGSLLNQESFPTLLLSPAVLQSSDCFFILFFLTFQFPDLDHGF